MSPIDHVSSGDVVAPGGGIEDLSRAAPGHLVQGSENGQGLRIGICCSQFNAAITERLLSGAKQALSAAGVDAGDVTTVLVPGAFELPLAAQALAKSGVDAVVCLGAVIRGETTHYDLVANAAASGCLGVSLETSVPIGFGVLSTEDLDQALERSGGKHGNKGGEAVDTAIAMVHVLRAVGSSPADSRKTVSEESLSAGGRDAAEEG